MIRHDIIRRRFVEGLSVSELATRYKLAEWEVEVALRAGLAPSVLPTQQELVIPASSPQLSIAEVYGEIRV
jgi:hypothetical protein